MKIAILILFIINSFCVLSQEQPKFKEIYLNSDLIDYNLTNDINEEVKDTVYFIYLDKRDSADWKVFNNHQDGILVLECKRTDYGYLVTQYHNNGQIFRLIEEGGNGELLSITIWCENGTIVSKYKLSNQPQHITNYYCNGLKKNEFTMHKFSGVGDYKCWYENGSLKIEGHYNDEGLKHGKWKYFEIDNKLIKEETYQEGEKIKEENH